MPFKKGVFYLAQDTKQKIIPVIIYGANAKLPPGYFFPKSGTVIVRYLKSIAIQQDDTVETL